MCTIWCPVDGGRTDQTNGVALCHFHHDSSTNSTWTVTIGPDQRPTFIPPAEIDPERQPRRNVYLQRT